MDFSSKAWVAKDGGLKGLKPVLNNWVARSVDFCKAHGFTDNGWWYNERASLSVLAAAAWTTRGWTALEEYATTKQGFVPPGEADSGKVKSGRCDLWIGNGTGYAVEAKQAWQSIGPGASGKNPRVWGQFENARKEAGRLTCDEADKRVAALFVSPYIPVAKVSSKGRGSARKIDRQAVCELVDEWVSALDLQRVNRVDAFAWVFPTRCDAFVSRNGQNIFPGSLLIMSERLRANRRNR